MPEVAYFCLMRVQYICLLKIQPVCQPEWLFFMRVLHIIDSGGMYGAEVMLLNLIEEQVRQGLSSAIASIGDHTCGEKPLEVEARRRGFSIKLFRMRPGPNFMGAWEILKYARSSGYQLLHSHGYKGNILLGIIPSKIRRIPLITTVHGWTSTGTSFTRMRMYEWLDSWLLPRVDAVVLVNQSMLAHPRLVGKKNIKLYIVNNGISTEEPSPSSCEELPIRRNSGVNIVAVGRLSPEKGFDILLKAMALVIESGKDVSLVVFGEGGERQKLENLICQLGLQDRVRMPGFIKNAAATFSCFDFLVMPSLTEGLPITLLEAMRARLPVIASRVGGIPKLLTSGVSGLLVEPNNEKELAVRISELAGSLSQRRKLALAAWVIFKEKYSSVQMAIAYQQIYVKTLTEIENITPL